MDWLQEHHGRWRVRVRVPPAVIDAVGKRVLTRTTGTSDYDRAVKLSGPILRQFGRMVDRAMGRAGNRRGKNLLATNVDFENSSYEWYTPPELFQAMGVAFDLDPCSPGRDVTPWIPAREFYTKLDDGLIRDWGGRFVFMNCPFGERHGVHDWISKFLENGNGVALVSDFSSTNWWHRLVDNSDATLSVKPKIQFLPRQGGRRNAIGSTLVAIGERGVTALENAERNGRGLVLYRRRD